MKFIGLILGGLFSVIGHMFSFVIKNVYIQIRRFTMDPTNKNTLWNIQAVTLLSILLMFFFLLIGRYQDLLYGLSEPFFFRAIPLLLPCFMGHIIYSCPIFFKNSYSKPVIQTFLNALSTLALGQIILNYISFGIGMVIVFILLIGIIILTLYQTLHLSVQSTIFNKLHVEVEKSKRLKNARNSNSPIINMTKKKDTYSGEEIFEMEGIDITKAGSLSHLRYYSEDCILQLFHTEPTKERQSQLIMLKKGDRAQHEQIIGGTGSGKTLLGTNLIVQDLLNDYIGSTIIEPKGSLIRRIANFLDRVGRPYYRLDPEIEDSDCLNPLYVPEGFDIEPMIEANVAAYHGYLGPTAKDFYKNRTTNLLRVSIKALKLAFGNDCTYNEVNKLIQPLEDEYRAEVLATIKERGFENQVGYLREYTKNMADTQKSREYAEQTNSNLYDYLNMLTSNKKIQKILCGKSTFNIDDALERGEIILFNGDYGALMTLTYTIGRLFLNLLRASTFRRNITGKVRPHQLTVDEIEMFADEEFSTFMEMAREFEFYVRVIHQGNEQLDDVSTRLSAMVKQNAVQKYILAGLGNDDGDYYAKMIGEFYEITESSGTDEMSTTGFKTQIKEEKRFKRMPSEILNLRGYNKETGEAGEVLFRGVQNNKRMDTVKGLLLPLPNILFTDIVDDDLEENLFKETPEINIEEDKNEHKQRLEHLKKRASEKIAIDENDIPIDGMTNSGTSEGKVVIRSDIWDSVKSRDNKEEILLEEEKIMPLKKVENRTMKTATVDDKTLQVAAKIKALSVVGRNKKENSKSE